jgi:hypothetical protein
VVCSLLYPDPASKIKAKLYQQGFISANILMRSPWELLGFTGQHMAFRGIMETA